MKKWKKSCLFGGFFKSGSAVYIEIFGDERGGTRAEIGKNMKGRIGI